MHGAIPFLAIDAYARRLGHDEPDEFERLLFLLREMDGAFLAHANAKK